MSRPCTCGLTLIGEVCDGRSHNRILSLSPSYVRDSAARLAAANVEGVVLQLIGPLAETEGPNDFSNRRAPITRADALVFAAALSDAQTQRGWLRAGYKVGWAATWAGSNSAPFGSPLCARDVIRVTAFQSNPVPTRVGFLPRGVELELAVVLRAPLPPRNNKEIYTPAEATAAVAHWAPAIEISGTRLRQPPGRTVSPLLRLADGGSQGVLYLLNADAAAWEVLEGTATSALEATLTVDGEVVARGGSAGLVRGSPAAALAWLANDLNAKGLPPLTAGDVVTTGTLTGLIPVRPGALVEVRWGGVPSAEMFRFTMPLDE